MAETRRRHGGPDVHGTSGASTAGSRFDGMSVSWLGGGSNLSLDAPIRTPGRPRRIRLADETRRPLRLAVARVRRDIGCRTGRPDGPPAAPCNVIVWARPRPGLVRVPARREDRLPGNSRPFPPRRSRWLSTTLRSSPDRMRQRLAEEAGHGVFDGDLGHVAAGLDGSPGARFVIDLASGWRDGREWASPTGPGNLRSDVVSDRTQVRRWAC